MKAFLAISPARLSSIIQRSISSWYSVARSSHLILAVPLAVLSFFLSAPVLLAVKPFLSTSSAPSPFTNPSPAHSLSIDIYPSSGPGIRKQHACPSLPARAVLPTRWRWSEEAKGGSYSITRSMFGRSRPREATSVQRRMEGVGERVKDWRVEVRVFWSREPWSL